MALFKQGFVDGLAPGLNSIRPISTVKAAIGFIEKASTKLQRILRAEVTNLERKKHFVFAWALFYYSWKSGAARGKGEGEKEKDCTTESKSRRRRDEKAPWALNYGSGERGGVEKGRRRGGEKHAMHV